ncbi:MAG: pectinesterase family protein [Defluviitaleaceae bacterium]|nr:pectinesterase family protein [Defluviitaleaceae bacterium]
MLKLTVSSDGDFRTISEALLAVPYEVEAIIYIAEGTYEEKIFCEKKNIILIGDSPDKTIIRWGDYANKLHSDGRKLGTFRSYTAFFGGEQIRVYNLSIINTSGDNSVAGQAIAAYVDAKIAKFNNVHFDSYQDTLFCAPLPCEEREIGGFFGPRFHSKRTASVQFYDDCRITGNVDFVFGGADVFFRNCEIISKTLYAGIVGYVAAPSGKADGIGFVFEACSFINRNCAKGSVYLARPWREEGKVKLINCYIDNHIHEEGWSAWNPDDSLETNMRTTFIEHECYGPGADTSRRVSWAKKQ